MAQNMRYNQEAERRRRQAEQAALDALRRQRGQAPKQPMPVQPPVQRPITQPRQPMPPQPPVQEPIVARPLPVRPRPMPIQPPRMGPITQPRQPAPRPMPVQPPTERRTPLPTPGGSVGGGLPRLPKQPPRQQPPAKKKKPPREPGMNYKAY